MNQVKVVNKTKKRILATHADLAQQWWKRCKGLLGRRELKEGCGMILLPCQSIHTLFMRFSIDVAFIDPDGQVIAWKSGMKPFRLSKWYGKASWTLELPAGSLSHENISVGDKLEIEKS